MNRWSVEVDKNPVEYYDQSRLSGNVFSPINCVIKSDLDLTYSDSLLVIL